MALKFIEGECPACGCMDNELHHEEQADGEITEYYTCQECGIDYEQAYSITYAYTYYETEGETNDKTTND